MVLACEFDISERELSKSLTFMVFRIIEKVPCTVTPRSDGAKRLIQEISC